MKKSLSALLITITCIFTMSCSNRTNRIDKKNEVQATEVPAVIKTAFTQKFPAATQIVWEKAHEDYDDSYKVKFKSDGDYWKAEYKTDGSLIKVKKDLD
jgi:hypothetical protein